MLKRRVDMRAFIIAIIVVSALGAAFFAFRNEFTQENHPAGRADEPDEINNASRELAFWHIQNYSPTKEVIDAAVARFEAKHPNVRVIQNRIANDQFKRTLDTAFGANDAPDIFHTWGGGVLESYVDEGLVLCLDSIMKTGGLKQRLLPSVLPFAQINGSTYCVPVDLGMVPMFYNKEIFAELNLEIPSSFGELLSVCKKLKAKRYIPIALGNVDKWPGCFYYVYGAVRAGGKMMIDRAVALEPGAFKHAGFRHAGRMITTLCEAGVFNKGFQGMSTSDSRRLFFTGRAAMTLMGIWLIAKATKESEDMLNKLGCFPFPALDGMASGDPKAVVGGINCAFAINSNCRYPELAKELLQYLSDEQFVSQWAKTGRIPAIRGAKDSDYLPITREVFHILSGASYIQMYFDQLFPRQLGETHKETVQELFSGKMTPDNANGKMDAVARKLRK